VSEQGTAFSLLSFLQRVYTDRFFMLSLADPEELKRDAHFEFYHNYVPDPRHCWHLSPMHLTLFILVSLLPAYCLVQLV
jgi:hypothetical protein